MFNEHSEGLSVGVPFGLGFSPLRDQDHSDRLAVAGEEMDMLSIECEPD